MDVLAPQSLAQRAFQSADQGIPISFVILITVPPNAAPNHYVRVVLIHRIAKFHTVVGLPDNEWSDRAFMLKERLVQGQLRFIEWDPILSVVAVVALANSRIPWSGDELADQQTWWDSTSTELRRPYKRAC